MHFKGGGAINYTLATMLTTFRLYIILSPPPKIPFSPSKMEVQLCCTSAREMSGSGGKCREMSGNRREMSGNVGVTSGGDLYLEVDHLADVSSYPSRVECGDRSELSDGRDI